MIGPMPFGFIAVGLIALYFAETPSQWVTSAVAVIGGIGIAVAEWRLKP